MEYYSLYYFTKPLMFPDICVFVEATLKLCTSCLGVTWAQNVTSWLQNTTPLAFGVSKLAQFKIHATLNFVTVPDWLTVTFRYFLTGPKVEILSALSPLAATHLTLFPVSNSYEPHCARPLVFLNVPVWLIWYPPQHDLRCPRAVKVYNFEMFHEVP